MPQGEMLPITNETARKGTRAAALARTAKKEDSLNNNGNLQSKKYIERLEEFRDLGLSLNPDLNTTPSPSTVLKVLEIVKHIQKGETQVDVWNWICDTYNLSLPTAKKYYTAALNFLLPEEGSEAQKRAMSTLLIRYEELYKRAYDEGQLKTARDILDSLAKLQGLAGQGNTIKYAENANGEKMVVVTFD